MQQTHGFMRGFTIVELVAVMVITGILAAVAAPRFIGADAFEARGSYGTLLATLRYAQKTAIAQRKPVYAKLDTAAHVVCLGYTSNCSSPLIDPATQAAYTKTLSNNLTLTASSATLGFDGLGRPLPNAQATFTLQNAAESTRTITVEAETGYVH
ncbi:MAG: GspH/FimT family pseudopilin [Methylophilaceae bacterium]